MPSTSESSSRGRTVLAAVVALVFNGCATIPAKPPATALCTPPDGEAVHRASAVAPEARYRWQRPLNEYLDSLAATGHAGTVLVMIGGRPAFTRGFGLANRELHVANGPITPSDIASIVKVFTAVAIMQLEREGLLRLTDSLPRFFDAVPADKRAITVAQLLAHSSGLQANHDTAGDFEPMTREQAVRHIMALPLRFTPGSKEGYSNSGYTLLAAILERETRTSWQEYLQLHVFDVAGMSSTWFWGDRGIPAAEVAHGYVAEKDMGNPRDWPLTWASMGGAGVVTTVGDLCRLTVALDAGALLPAESVAEMFRPPLKKWTFGWEASVDSGGRLVMKGGASDFGYTAQLRLHLDRNVTVIVLLNAKTSDDDYPHQVIGPAISKLVLEGGE